MFIGVADLELDYTALPVPEVRWEDLEPLEFERFRHFIRGSRGQGDIALLGVTDLELAKTRSVLYQLGFQVSYG